MSTGLNDNEIITQVLGGNTQAYAVLVKKYQSFVFTMALRYTKSREDAEEVSQDIFVKAFKALRDFRQESKFSTWLYTIVNTTCLSFLRKKKLMTQSLDNDNLFEKVANSDSGIRANMVEQKSKIAMVHDAINMLAPDDAEIITLFYNAEQSLDEIARILKIESNTAKVRLHRARLRLKEKMEAHFSEEIKNLSNP